MGRNHTTYPPVFATERARQVPAIWSSNDHLIDETIRIWEPRYGRTLGREEAREILENAVRWVSALAEIVEEIDRGGAAERRPET